MPALEPPVKRRRGNGGGRRSPEQRETEIEASLAACTEESSGWVEFENEEVLTSVKYPLGVRFHENPEVLDKKICWEGLKAWAELYLSEKKKK